MAKQLQIKEEKNKVESAICCSSVDSALGKISSTGVANNMKLLEVEEAIKKLTSGVCQLENNSEKMQKALTYLSWKMDDLRKALEETLEEKESITGQIQSPTLVPVS